MAVDGISVTNYVHLFGLCDYSQSKKTKLNQTVLETKYYF